MTRSDRREPSHNKKRTRPLKRVAHAGIPRNLWLLTPAAIGMSLFVGLENWLLSFAIALVLVWLALNINRQAIDASPLRLDPANTLMLLFWCWLAASVLWSHAPAESLFQLWLATLPIATCWAYCTDPESERLWWHICRLGLLVASILATISCYQYFFLGEPARSVFFTRNTHAGFMNLMLLSAFTYAVRSDVMTACTRNWRRVGMGALVFTLSFSIALTTSRGATLSLLLALGLIVTMLIKQQLAKYALGWIGLIVAAFTLVHLPLGAGNAPLAERQSLAVVDDRLLIWSGTWKMLMDAPWVGIGIGTYPLAWPRYKDPADASSGFFAHNEYLQLWVETGIPGLVLLLALGTFLILRYRQTMRSTVCTPAMRIEITGLGTALLAISAHSFVDFNFHVPIIALAIGLILGRFSQITAQTGSTTSWGIFSNVAKQAGAMAGTAVLIFATLYLLTYGLGDIYAKLGTQRARQGELFAADSAFRTATTLGRLNDRVLSAYADFLRQLSAQLPATKEQEKKYLLETSLQLLDKVESLNSLRWDSAAIRAKLHQNNRELLGPDWIAASTAAYRRALALNPRFHEARTDLAILLLNVGDARTAVAELWAGIHFAYPQNTRLVPYYATALAVHKQWGSPTQTEAIQQRLIALEDTLNNRASESDCPLPARLWEKC